MRALKNIELLWKRNIKCLAPYHTRLPEELKERLNTFRHKCLDWRMDYASKEDMKWAIKEAKTLLLEIDRHFGVEVERGTWE